MYGAPPPTVFGTLTEQSEQLTPNYLTAFETVWLVQEKIWPFICSYYSRDEQENLEHSIKPGDWVCVETLDKDFEGMEERFLCSLYAYTNCFHG